MQKTVIKNFNYPGAPNTPNWYIYWAIDGKLLLLAKYYKYQIAKREVRDYWRFDSHNYLTGSHEISKGNSPQELWELKE